SVVDLAISDNGDAIVVVTAVNRMTEYDRQGNLEWSITLEVAPSAVGISPDGSYVAVGTVDGKVTIFSRSGAKLYALNTDGQVEGVDLTTGAERVVIGSLDNHVYVYEGFPASPVTPTSTPTVTQTTPTSEPTQMTPTGTPTPVPGGAFSLTSVPAGAEVRIGGIPAGVTPLTVSDLTPGSYMVEVSAEGYNTAEISVAIASGETTSLAVELVPVTIPAGAGIPFPAAALTLILAAGIALWWRQGHR
ncbi:MAG: PEGA domain-containing protein, partial [Methanomicrobiales archaeon]|nr:PEGA domain-containing protein [Methanomicrobiales archaeon]